MTDGNAQEPTAEEPSVGDGAEPATAARGLPRWVKAILLLILIAVGVVVLFTWVFPWVEARMQDPTMGAGVGLPLGHGVPFIS